MGNYFIFLVMTLVFCWSDAALFQDYIEQAYKDEVRKDNNLVAHDLSGLTSLLTKGCGGINADLAFVLDNSASIWAPDFTKQTAFVKDFISVFDISPKRVRVSVVTFGDRVYSKLGFRFFRYKTAEEVSKAVMDIPYMAGMQTRTDKALEHMKKNVFKKMRKGVEHIVIVMTDGDSLYPMRTKRAARYLKQMGITVYAIGVGYSVSLKELNSIASSKEGIFRVDNFDALQNIKQQLGVQICPVPTTPVPTIPPCGISDPTDINFVCDGVQMDAATNRDVKDIVKSLVSQEGMQHEGMQIALITSECPELKSVPFSKYQSTNKTKFPEVFDDVHYQTYGSLIEILNNEGFSAERGGRDSARHVGVVILSQEPEDAEDVIMKASAAKEKGIELFAVGLNKKVRKIILEQIASDPKPDHVIMVSSHREVSDVGPKIAQTLCPHDSYEVIQKS